MQGGDVFLPFAPFAAIFVGTACALWQGGDRLLLGPAARGQKRGGEGGEEEKEEKEGEKGEGKRGEKRGGGF